MALLQRFAATLDDLLLDNDGLKLAKNVFALASNPKRAVMLYVLDSVPRTVSGLQERLMEVPEVAEILSGWYMQNMGSMCSHSLATTGVSHETSVTRLNKDGRQMLVKAWIATDMAEDLSKYVFFIYGAASQIKEGEFRVYPPDFLSCSVGRAVLAAPFNKARIIGAAAALAAGGKVITIWDIQTAIGLDYSHIMNHLSQLKAAGLMDIEPLEPSHEGLSPALYKWMPSKHWPSEAPRPRANIAFVAQTLYDLNKRRPAAALSVNDFCPVPYRHRTSASRAIRQLMNLGLVRKVSKQQLRGIKPTRLGIAVAENIVYPVFLAINGDKPAQEYVSGIGEDAMLNTGILFQEKQPARAPYARLQRTA